MFRARRWPLPSTQIWIPSTDIQAYKTLHLGIDDYIRTKKNPDGTYSPITYDAGLTAGVLPFEKIQMEIGIDYIRYGVSAADDDTRYTSTRSWRTPEDSMFKWSPALAIGIYNVGYGAARRTRQAHTSSRPGRSR